MKYNSDNIVYVNNDIRIVFEYLCEHNKEYLRFMLYIENAYFQGQQQFYLYIEDVKTIIDELNNMYNTLNGQVYFFDTESESYCKLCTSGYNNVIISGKIGNIYDAIKLEFEFSVDQTVISILKNILLNALNQIR